MFAGEEESVACTVKLDVPAACGVPEMVPVVMSKLSPSGSDPLASDHVYGVVPFRAPPEAPSSFRPRFHLPGRSW